MLRDYQEHPSPASVIRQSQKLPASLLLPGQTTLKYESAWPECGLIPAGKQTRSCYGVHPLRAAELLTNCNSSALVGTARNGRISTQPCIPPHPVGILDAHAIASSRSLQSRM